ncbi:adenosylcobinamide amidohydrolase [Paenibacillus silvae]|uniref:adenosylcobinamide amidohydrolase n=1 Tax=Paenibacillus silvae TaxID=1325358 RepID=UPI0011A03977|nr:adenosylcobinamide amidohydrolase [Paenibacillus xylanexedens]MCK6074764.1 adenosylcobinamide amidohydrolase [Paenibacillus silvae]MCK6147761.1 adenosylcobinamide amidohydrolase [Paenibacillus silvae]MCK6266059.1 adenosylcobinamide amidohydrolase [Paenibacillus silvae]
MTLPFYNYFTHGKKDENTYVSSSWPGLLLSAHERRIKAQSLQPALALSSAVYGGGMLELYRVFNIYVDKHYRCDDPPRDIEQALLEWQERTELCAGLLTAVRLEHTSIQEYTCDAFGLLCCTTAGVSNAARAGSERTVFDAYGEKHQATASTLRGTEAVSADYDRHSGTDISDTSSTSSYVPGTINIMLWFNGQITQGAMVNAIQTAIEAKAAALADAGIMDSENGQTATGTTTDAIVLAVRQTEHESQPLHTYAGTATALGAVIGRLVYDTVTESLQAGLHWKERRGQGDNDI